MRGENDNESSAALVFFASPLALFLPAMLIAGASAALFAGLAVSGRGGSLTAGFGLVALTVVAPAAAARALLRWFSSRLRVMRRGMVLHGPTPFGSPVEIGYEAIADVSIRRDALDRVAGTATLDILRRDGRRLSFRRLARAEAARAAIEEAACLAIVRRTAAEQRRAGPQSGARR